jgi:hypothetical protein
MVNDKHLLRFSRGEEGFGSSIRNSFLPKVRASYFVIMILFAASMLILMAQAELLDLFLVRVAFR